MTDNLYCTCSERSSGVWRLGTSLAMAPAFVLGQLCEVVDLDGPIELIADRSPPAVYENGHIWCPREIWGGPATSRNVR